MKQQDNTHIIGIDHGYGNIKTANFCFPSGVVCFDSPPMLAQNLLTYNGEYYVIGLGHKAYLPNKAADKEYYILTLAAIAMELAQEHIREAKVYLAAGLPLTWVNSQKKAFRAYLMQNAEVRFSFRGKDYHIQMTGVDIFPQGFAAIADKLDQLTGRTMLCDIGNGTMNLLYLQDGVPDLRKMYTEKMGTQQCVNAIREAMMNRFQVALDEEVITAFLISGKTDAGKEYARVMQEAAAAYTESVFHCLALHDYVPGLMRLYIAGGGGCLIRNFGKFERSRETIDADICAAAKGYESICARLFRNEVTEH